MFAFVGWEGAGLGKAEQGIQDPIKQGDIRDKQDMYKVSNVEYYVTVVLFSTKIRITLVVHDQLGLPKGIWRPGSRAQMEPLPSLDSANTLDVRGSTDGECY